MDARVRLAGAGCAFVVAMTLAISARAATAESRASVAAGFVSTPLLDARADQSLDAGLLLELDELLLDPVHLEAGDVSRLRVLPWLGAAQIEVLARAKPPTSAAELAALPGWDVERARRTQPFVRFATPRETRPRRSHATLRAATLRTRRDVFVDASYAPFRVVARWTALQRQPVARSVHVDAASVRCAAGDVRMRHAQGLLWWSGEERLRASGSALRSASGLLAQTSLDASRAVRGVGLEAHRLLRARLLAGSTGRGRVACATLAFPVARFGSLELGAVHTPSRSWFGGAWSRHTPRTRMALEIAGRSGRTAVLAAAAWRTPRFSVRGRLEHAEALALSPWSAAAPTRRRADSRHGFLQVQLRHRDMRLELAAAHAARRDSIGARLNTSEQAANLGGALGTVDVELRLRQRQRLERSVGLESFDPDTQTRTRSVVVRARRPIGSATWLGVEYRAVETRTLPVLQSDSGHAWVLQLEHRTAPCVVRGIVTSFSAPSGRAAPYVPRPYVAGTYSSERVLGEGIRLAAGVACGERQLRLHTRAGCVFTRSGRSGVEVETSLALRLR